MSVGAVIRIERALLSLLAPLVGTRSTGSVSASALTSDVELPANTYGVPLISGAGATPAKQLDVTRMVKTTADTTVTAAGVSVPITSVLGGARTVLDEDTPIVWLPAITGLEVSSLVEAPGLAGGLDATAAPFARRIVVFEGIGKQDVADALWRARIGDFPALVISWEGAGSGQKIGRGLELCAHRFRIYIVVQRFDSDDARRDEGKILLGALREFLTDRSAADGESFSNPPTSLGAAGKLALAPTSYVYFQEVEVNHASVKLELRTFVPWTATEEVLVTDVTPEYPDTDDAVSIVDQTHDMDPDT